MKAPAAIVALGSPPKVTRRLEPATTAGPPRRTPMRAAPIDSGRVPYAFEIRTRSTLPPRLTRGIILNVWFAKAAPSPGAGAAVQVPTQCVVSIMASPLAEPPAEPRATPVLCYAEFSVGGRADACLARR